MTQIKTSSLKEELKRSKQFLDKVSSLVGTDIYSQSLWLTDEENATLVQLNQGFEEQVSKLVSLKILDSEGL